jgi:hypothetical protein
MNPVDSFFGEAAALETDGIQSISSRAALGRCLRKGEHIARDGGASADEGVGPDADEVMNGAQGSDGCPVFYRDMSAQRGPVCHDDVAADLTIMGDVGVGHDEVVVADASARSTLDGAAVDGDKLANHVVIANFESRRLAGVGNILRRQSDGGEREEVVVVANFRGAFDHHVRREMAALAQFHLGSNDAVRPNGARRVDFAFSVDDRRGMDGHREIARL